MRRYAKPHRRMPPFKEKQRKHESCYEKFRQNHPRRHAPRGHASPHLVRKIGDTEAQHRRHRRQRKRHFRRVQVPQNPAIGNPADDLQFLLLPQQHRDTGRLADEHGKLRPGDQDARRRHRSDPGARQRGAEPQQTRPAARDRRCDRHRLPGHFRPGGGLHGRQDRPRGPRQERPGGSKMWKRSNCRATRAAC